MQRGREIGANHKETTWGAQQICPRHYSAIPSQLHMMELSEGWIRLAKLLGKPIPEEPFPHANNAKEARN
ncbi:hypothetical protein jhhlp_005384 [Lomentospora prolificans]|uniref:Uncharacterized protein n=1 Tax=Lomentospora prolificans TaxID=41688 RepID=A0A2N3N6P4_9PEZI|nr:hypothetical protein jhhlp_005384 [Lomentospora prolificans]